MEKRKEFHVVAAATREWYHVDEFYRVWTCSCMDGNSPESKVSLCLTIDESLKREGELRELERKIAQKRKELGLKPGEDMPQA